MNTTYLTEDRPTAGAATPEARAPRTARRGSESDAEVGDERQVVGGQALNGPTVDLRRHPDEQVWNRGHRRDAPSHGEKGMADDRSSGGNYRGEIFALNPRFVPKSANVPGLQIADLIATPISRFVIEFYRGDDRGMLEPGSPVNAHRLWAEVADPRLVVAHGRGGEGVGPWSEGYDEAPEIIERGPWIGSAPPEPRQLSEGEHDHVLLDRERL
mgnify:CR=1 FL=1